MRTLVAVLLMAVMFPMPLKTMAGWFGPDNYAECMNGKLKGVKNGPSTYYAVEAASVSCFHKFCSGKSRVVHDEACQKLHDEYDAKLARDTDTLHQMKLRDYSNSLSFSEGVDYHELQLQVQLATPPVCSTNRVVYQDVTCPSRE